MARFLVLSEKELTELTKKGVFHRSSRVIRGRNRICYQCEETTQRYIVHLRAPMDEIKNQFVREKAETQRIVRAQKELELAFSRGELIDGDRVDREVIGVLSTIKSHMRALPSRLATLLQGKSRAEIRAIMRKYVDLALREATEFDLKQLRQTNGQHPKQRRVR